MMKKTFFILYLIVLSCLAPYKVYASSNCESLYSFSEVLLLDKDLQLYDAREISGDISVVEMEGKKYVNIVQDNHLVACLYIADKNGPKVQENETSFTYVLLDIMVEPNVPAQLFEIYDGTQLTCPREFFLIFHDPQDYSIIRGESFRNLVKIK